MLTLVVRTILLLFTALICLPAVVTAGNASASESAYNDEYLRGTPRIKAACALAPLQYVLNRIGGEFVDSLALVPAGADPHTFEPKTSQLQALSESDVYFSLNTPLENTWVNRIISVTPGLRAVDIAAGLDREQLLMEAEHSHGQHQHTEQGGGEVHEHGDVDDDDEAEHALPYYDGYDPHIWMSPRMLKQVAVVVYEEFSRQMPGQAAYFEKNLNTFKLQLDDLDAYVKETLGGLPEGRHSFLVFHPSWSYFAKEYGLTQIAVEQDGKEPTPASLAMDIQEARSEGISVIFVQKEFNPDVAATVAAHLPEGRVVVLDPLGPNPLQAIRETANAIAGKTAETEHP